MNRETTSELLWKRRRCIAWSCRRPHEERCHARDREGSDACAPVAVADPCHELHGIAFPPAAAQETDGVRVEEIGVVLKEHLQLEDRCQLHVRRAVGERVRLALACHSQRGTYALAR